MGKKAIATKTRIMNKTMSLLQETSLSDLSVREICEAAGIAKGTFYLYFEAKESVAWAILDENLVDAIGFLNGIEKLDPNEQSIEYIIDRILDYARDNSHFLKIIHHVRFTNYIGVDRLEMKYGDAWIKPLELFLKKGIEAGAFNIEDLTFTTHYISSSVHELIDQVIYDNSPYTLDQLRTKLKVVILKVVL